MSKKKRGECDNCGWKKSPVAQYDPMHDGEKYWFCDVCAGTFASKATYMKSLDTGAHLILRTLGAMCNMILDEIKKKKRGS